jgi:hypothetical protein
MSQIAGLNRRLSLVESVVNDPVAVGSTLARTSLASTTYVPGTTGWIINADGTGEITADVTILGAGGTVITIGPTAPVSPVGGQFWFNTSSGSPVMEVYNAGTSAWVDYQWGTNAIEDNAITQALLSNNAVGTAQIINGAITTTQIAAGAGIQGSQLAAAAGITSGQVAFNARQIGAVQVSVGPTAPASPNVGDLWIKSAS